MGPGNEKGREQKRNGLVSPKGPRQNIADTARGCRARGGAGIPPCPPPAADPAPRAALTHTLLPSVGNRWMPAVYPALITMAAAVPRGESPQLSILPALLPLPSPGPGSGTAMSPPRGWQLAEAVHGHEKMRLHRHHLQQSSLMELVPCWGKEMCVCNTFCRIGNVIPRQKIPALILRIPLCGSVVGNCCAWGRKRSFCLKWGKLSGI